MRRTYFVCILLLIFSFMLALYGCDKEKITESSKYIENTEYVQLPPDTIFLTDTVFNNDTTILNKTDTVVINDTVLKTEYIYDTTEIHDTVTLVQNYYDTTKITDTVLLAQCNPNEYLAYTALQYYSDPMVLEFINSEFGLTDGYMFYLTVYQIEITRQSSDVYDLYGYVDYWTTDWSGYYALEYYWRVTYLGGDPADPNNWQLSDPPAAVSGHSGGIKLKQNTETLFPKVR